MKVLVARAHGLCFGVRDALATAAAIRAPHEVTIHGELVHNEVVLDDLARRGFALTPENEREHLPATQRVMITAHGISNAERQRLRDAGLALIDTTCPLVARAHTAALRFVAGGYHVLVLGRPDHVEVRGLCGDLEHFDVVPTRAAVRRYPSRRIGVVCQTTFPAAEVAPTVAAVEAHNPGAEVTLADTVCEPTRQRAAAVQELAAQVPVVIVVGGRSSNNTTWLARLAEAAGARAYRVAGPDELDPAWLAGCERVGLTAGTSALDATVEAVRHRLQEIAPTT